MIWVTVAALLIAGAAVTYSTLQFRTVLRRRRHAPVIVTLKSGAAFKGVLADDDSRSLVLRNAESVDDGRPMPVDGEVIVPWGDVKYLQRL